MADSSTCDESYKDNCNACAFYNFGCGIVDNNNGFGAVFDIPTCFTGTAQSPINLDSSSATIADDPGQLIFSGYNENMTWPGPPVLRLKDFTVQLDFNQLKPKKQGVEKMLRKNRGRKSQIKRRKNQSTKRSKRENLSPPSISGGALGDSVWVFFRLSRVWAHFWSCHHLR